MHLARRNMHEEIITALSIEIMKRSRPRNKLVELIAIKESIQCSATIVFLLSENQNSYIKGYE